MSQLFYHKLQALRLTASVLYDQAHAQGKTHEQKAEILLPVQKRLLSVLSEALKNDFGGVLQAIQFFKNDLKKHDLDIQLLMNKKEDTKDFLNQIENQLLEYLKKNNETHKINRDFWVTLIDDQPTIR